MRYVVTIYDRMNWQANRTMGQPRNTVGQ